MSQEAGATAGVYYPLYDGNGNVGQYVNGSGTAVARFEYDGFGVSLVSTGTHASLFPHRFSTKYRDGETGLYYYGYRYYDAGTGRWPSRDPIEERGGANLYQMVHGAPTHLVDVLGLSGIVLWLRPTPLVAPYEVITPRPTWLPPGLTPTPTPTPQPVPMPYPVPPVVGPTNWTPYPNPYSPTPVPDEAHDNVDWPQVDRWTDEPTDVHEKQDRRHDVNDCCRLRDKYKNIQAKRPTGEGTCEDLYQKIVGLARERAAKREYMRADCDRIPLGNNSNHQQHIDNMGNEIEKLKKKIFDRGCWKMNEFDFHHQSEPASSIPGNWA